jgi:OOP family OmpA-OmpF porin
VKIYLVGKGVNAERITSLGMGPANPIDSNDTLEGRRRNRRVEIEFETARDKSLPD